MVENAGYTETISTKDFPTNPRFVLEQPTGDVRVEGWDREEIEVSISDPSSMFEIEQAGALVTVRNRPGKFKMVNFVEAEEAIKGMRLGFEEADLEDIGARVERSLERGMRRLGRKLGSIDPSQWMGGGRDYNIRVPHNCDLALRTSSGDLEIRSVNGTLFIQSTSGDIRMVKCGGSALVNSSSGDIKIEDLEGKLGVRTVSGDIKTQRLNLQEVSAGTTSGDLELDLLRLPQNELELKSVSGDLNLAIPSDSRLTFEITTVSGDVNCGFPRSQVSYSSNRRRGMTLSLNGGGPVVNVATVSGNVSVRPNRANGQPQPAEARRTVSVGEPTMDLSRTQGTAEPTQDAAGDITQPEGYVERQQAELEILQAVQRGELSPQEAVRRLGELDGR
jgi:DUF4097 and DUF4098 domain-containing protein YvlB